VPYKFRLGLLADNNPLYVNKELKQYFDKYNIWQTHGKPYYPTKEKIEQYHRSIKNIILLNNYFSPEKLEKAIAQWIHRYNYQRYYKALNNVTPVDMYYGCVEDILKRREEIKKQTTLERRIYNRLNLIDNKKN